MHAQAYPLLEQKKEAGMTQQLTNQVSAMSASVLASVSQIQVCSVCSPSTFSSVHSVLAHDNASLSC